MGKGGGGGVGRDAIKAGASTFWSSQGARKAVFQQLNSALRTGGGAGFKSGVVQAGVSRSLAAGRQALAGAGADTAGMDPSVRSRVINRLIQSGKNDVSRMGPAFAAKLIGQAPAAFNAAGAGSAGLMDVAGAGEAAGRQAAAIRAQGWANAASAVASSAGRAAGDYWNRPTDTTIPTSTPAPAPAAPSNGAGWYDRFFGGK